MDPPQAQWVHHLQNVKSLLFATLAALIATQSVAYAQETTPPTFDQVVAAVTAYFKALPDYQPNDLVSAGIVAGAIDAVSQTGWQVPYPEKIKKFALADDSFLVQQLATAKGKKFMRNVARHQGSYSRLDRLSRISDGQQAVKTLIADPGGDTMITYMATTPGGYQLGAMMAGTPHGTDLNKPTGRIYTADDLLALLKKLYAIEFTSTAK